MYAANAQRILDSLRSADVVLDVGGWACPFNRANHVLDAEPYETRGYYRTLGLPASQGGDREWFSRATWVQRDICGREPFPFRDKEIDFVICSHVLEDIRDPLWVCAEMIRVAKRGYVEVPSRFAESCRGWESPKIAGLSHHRWLIDVDPTATSLRFLMKYHCIHSHWRLSFPASALRSLKPEKRVSWFFWDGSFSYSEITIHGADAITQELEGYVRRMRPYPPWMVAADRCVRRVRSLASRAWGKLTRSRVDPE